MFHSLVELTRIWSRHRHLLLMLANRQFLVRYRGSFLGIFWTLLNPLLLLLVYGFVFTYLFPPRFNMGSQETIPFAIILFAGIMVHQYMADCLVRAPGSILEQTSFVKKIVFPLELLVPSYVLSNLTVFMIQWILLLGATIATSHQIHIASVAWLPFVFIPFTFMIIGLSWILAAIGVYIRDISHMMNLVMMVLLFISPVFYPIDVFPEPFKHLLYLNPQTFPIEQLRNLMIFGATPNWSGMIIYACASLTIFCIGFLFFRIMKKGFADVI